MMPSPSAVAVIVIVALCHLCFSVSPNQQTLCLDSERTLLLQIKHEISINTSIPFFQPPPPPKVWSWSDNRNHKDCCLWEGVTCDSRSSHVVGLDLSSSSIVDGINGSSSIFRLRHLQSLSLADNNLDDSYSPFPYGFGNLSSLTHLNLSYAGFQGPIPEYDISTLGMLVSLDLSNFNSSVDMEKLVVNLTRLKVLGLDELYLSGGFTNKSLSLLSETIQQLSLSNCGLTEEVLQFSSFLRLRSLTHLVLSRNDRLAWNVSGYSFIQFPHLIHLDLSSCGLYGTLSSSVFLLPNLQLLDVSSNTLTGSLPEFSVGSIPLQAIYLSYTNFSGKLPDSIKNLASLQKLDLYYCSFYGRFPNSLFFMPNLQTLDVSYNTQLIGSLPEFPVGNIPLQDIHLSNTNFSGKLPYSIKNLVSLQKLHLDSCKFYGRFPSSLFFMPTLQVLDVSNNTQLTGSLPEFPVGSIPLQRIFLSNTNFSGKLPDSINNLVSLQILDLYECNFNGFIPSSINNLTELRYLSFSQNNFHGPLPSLLASSNTIELLDFSYNNFNGTIPTSYGYFDNLRILDLRNNDLQGQIPPFSFRNNEDGGKGYMSGLSYLDLSSNKINGNISPSLCDIKFLEVLVLSINHLNGSIPSCLVSLQFLGVLSLKNNELSGMLPKNFAHGCSLRTLDVNQNNLHGQIPESLGLCKALEVVDVGKNNFTRNFPFWLEDLQELRVLALHSNQFGGSIDSQNPNGFLVLQILDISSNKFVGKLPSGWFRSWNGMKSTTRNGVSLNYEPSITTPAGNFSYSGYFYQDSVTVIVKGIERNYLKVLTIFVLLDVSNNNFTGEIPETIAHLESLQLLNLSNNHFTGHIPQSFEQLRQLESLDFSSNNLSSNIPSQLTVLTFLAFLNTSHNSLSGEIPHGKQFDTFDANSYMGNPQLCGKPLPKPCFEVKSPPSSATSPTVKGWKSMIDWNCFRDGTACGWGAGVILGIVIAKLVYGNPFIPPKTKRIKHEISINTSFSDIQPPPPPKVWSWNDTRNHKDCCLWEGVTCDSRSGHVVGLDLSSSFIVGGINSSNNIFRLRHIQSLSLADNYLHVSGSTFPYGFSNLSSLTHLNLSYARFEGPIPEYDISTLGMLVSLDLSNNGFNSVHMEKLVKNLTRLRVLYLDGFDLSLGFTNKLLSLLPETIQQLSLSGCGLTGEVFPFSSFLRLRSLTHLVLSGNDLAWNVSGYSFIQFPHLIHLDLSWCGLYGTLSSRVFLLPNLQFLDVSYNTQLTGSLPEFPIGNIPLQTIILSRTKFSRKLPDSIKNLLSLQKLDLSYCTFYGIFPNSIFLMSTLQVLDVSNNTQLTGSLPEFPVGSIPLQVICLSNTNFSGKLPDSINNLVSLQILDLSECNFTGFFPASIDNLTELRYLSFSRNNFHGRLPSLLASSNTIKQVDFSHNNFSGTIPTSYSYFDNLEMLNLRNNDLQGQMPSFLFRNNEDGEKGAILELVSLDLSSNKINGNISPSLCDMKFLRALDLSTNHLNGSIPSCLVSLEYLVVLSLKNNELSGMLPKDFVDGCNLKTLDMNQNNLHGQIPKSLGLCKDLEVLDVGKNNLTVKFPFWLEDLQELRVLALHSNQFGGSIDSQNPNGFRVLQILDISSNKFVGKLPSRWFRSWDGMMKSASDEGGSLGYIIPTTDMRDSDLYSPDYFYQDSVTVIVKGTEREYPKILTIFVLLDVSNNNFVGEIPETIGHLESLQLLNLSNNQITGHIPQSFKQLRKLESLDFSSNNLSGNIPSQLTKLTFLSVFNTSHNSLSGEIPIGKQFDTFDANSYMGNPQLCGKPLPKPCFEVKSPSSLVTNPRVKGWKSMIDWNCFRDGTACGWGAGVILGIVIAKLVYGNPFIPPKTKRVTEEDVKHHPRLARSGFNYSWKWLLTDITTKLPRGSRSLGFCPCIHGILSLIIMMPSPSAVAVIVIVALCHLCFSVSPNQQTLCLDSERTLLLQINHEISVYTSFSHFQPPPPLWSWNDTRNHKDCCLWEGVTCDSRSGHVVGLDLSSSFIVGGINGSSSIFRLRHLQSLSLADNHLDVSGSTFPFGFGNLSSLTHLNLSKAGFEGPIPEYDISTLGMLVSLDLSYNGDSSVDMEKLVVNLTRLRVLYLDLLDLSRGFTNKSLSLLPETIQQLSLNGCRLTGEVLQFSSFLRLRSLTHLILSDNDLTWNVSGYSFIQFPHLIHLDISWCWLYGTLSSSVFLLPNLQFLDVSGNYQLTGSLPEFPIGNIPLQTIYLSDTNFSGKLPDSIKNLVSLQELDLRSCKFYGRFSSSIFLMPNLQFLDVYNNTQLTGSLPEFPVGSMPFQTIYLSYTNFSGKLPHSINNLVSLQILDLTNCNFTGFVPASIDNLTELRYLFFSRNNFYGPLPSLLASSKTIELFDFSYNNFNGTIPTSYGYFDNLVVLNLRNNDLQGQIPPFSFRNNEDGGKGYMSGLSYLDLSSNKINGNISPSLCDMNFIEVLDLSSNHLNGSVPSCLVSLESLEVLSLKNNELSGMLPKNFAHKCNLRTLDVNKNNLHGQIPKSLGLCKDLEVLDVGKNNLTGKFPLWLEDLPALRVLVLHSNKFGGSIDSQNPNGFPVLQILDVSSNKFVGKLPSRWFRSWDGMMKSASGEGVILVYMPPMITPDGYLYFPENGYYDSITVIVKGIEREYPKILTIFVLLDVSNNNFVGEIPETIGHLESLQLLNLSNNHFTGHIPRSFEQLRKLESLDISSNNLSGNIPSQLTVLTFLALLNTSHNSLSGEIPHGNQFNTFDANSYLGNPQLCGKPLPKPCFEVKSPPSSATSPTVEGWKSMIDWNCFRDGTACGWGAGVILGIVIAKLVILTLIFIMMLSHAAVGVIVLLVVALFHLCSSVSPIQTRCLDSERTLLLQIKHEISINTSFSYNSPPPPLPPKVWSWNNSKNHKDCCLWEGVTCDSRSGHVVGLDLSSSSIVDGINSSSSIFRLHHLRSLSLADNVGDIMFTYSRPPFPYGFSNLSSLTHLNLSDAGFRGPIPEYDISTLGMLVSIDLSNNDLSVDMEKLVKNLTRLRVLKLDELDLSRGFPNKSFLPETIQQLSLRYCSVTGENNFHGRLPSLLASSNTIKQVDFSHNNFSGTIPTSYCYFDNLEMLNLRNNDLQGHIPSFSFRNNEDDKKGDSTGLVSLDLSSNKINGNISPSLCDMKFLEVIHLSTNHLNGSIPSCLVSLKSLRVLSLKNNGLSGMLPKDFAHGCNLKTLDVNQNNLHGQIPKSLGLCKDLEVLDVGKNNLTGKFSFWLEDLQKLRVLTLHSNRFGGSIDSQNPNGFPVLHILDVSSNKFVGKLPSGWFRNWFGMMDSGEGEGSIDYFYGEYTYYDSVTVTAKGTEREYPKILTIFVLLDVSNNNFTGEIPETIAHLEYLQLLNLSNNHFTGHIPRSFEQLKKLESLDFSSNNLSGNIPSQLIVLTFLSVFNMSHNSLSGEIPHGKQFDTFDANSYLGNPELCGKPLPKPCFEVKSPPSSATSPTVKGWQSMIDWNCFRDGTACGWGAGVILGIVIAKLVILSLIITSIIMMPSPSAVAVIVIVALCHLCFSVSPNQQTLCLDSERTLLLQIKHEISINTSISYIQPPPPPKVWSWNDTGNHKDCCLWEGVTCDSRSGHVVGLDLSSSFIVGGINNSSSIFRLRHLQSLSLADNYLDNSGSTFPFGFGNLSSLTHLNLSYAGFQGPIPESDISTLGMLVSLDLSNSRSSVDMEKLVKNLTRVRVLYLDQLDLSRGFPNKSLLPETIQQLSMSWCGLTGEVLQFSSFLHLRSLTHLVLYENKNLAWNVSGYSFIQFPHLIHLDLFMCGLYGTLSSSVFLLPNLQFLDVSNNDQLTGSLPEFPIGNIPLKAIYLTDTNFSGKLPDSIKNLVSLQELHLGSCKFYGRFPSSLFFMPTLQVLDVSNNTQLDGSLPEFPIGNIPLQGIYLSNTNFSGKLPDSINNLVSLQILDLTKCNFTGFVPASINNLTELRYLSFSQNNFHGRLPSLLASSNTIKQVDFSHNNFSGTIPTSYGYFDNLEMLNLRNNDLQGQILPFLFHNNKDGEKGDLSGFVYLDLSSNKIKGNISTSLCDMKNLEVINLSSNHLNGSIPSCLVSLQFLGVLSLKNNELSGMLPKDFVDGCNLRTLDVSQNNLHGQIPESLGLCTLLEVLDVGKNNLTGKFPFWLEDLQELSVLALHSNQFGGSIDSRNPNGFPVLQILDVSSNKFVGKLPSGWFRNWIGMMKSSQGEGGGLGYSALKATPDNYYSLELFYQDSVTVIAKGIEREYPTISDIFVLLDMSNNNFVGEIPETIGHLEFLQLLNLSNNHFTGHIPRSFEQLRKLESLDFSSNNLSGNIPSQLNKLTFLALLNTSHNSLSGEIPHGKQFDTFDANSYLGNPELRGKPLPKPCFEVKSPSSLVTNPRVKGWQSMIDWNCFKDGTACGWGAGVILGIVIAKLVYGNPFIPPKTKRVRRIAVRPLRNYS
ncbi:Receptor-like protein 7 [Linum perenne]